MNTQFRAIAIAAALTAGLSAPAFAGTVALTLTRANLTNVTDAAGAWQIETGTVARGTTPAGQYEIERRTSTGGSDAQNTAAERVTMFLLASRAGVPENVILEGAHGFNTGAFTGSVAAASPRYAFLRGADATAPTAGTSYTITLTWTGAFAFQLP